MSNVVALPTSRAVDGAWDRYITLIEAQKADDALLTDVAHQQDVARAWVHWRDALTHLGHNYAVVRSIEDTAETLERWGWAA